MKHHSQRMTARVVSPMGLAHKMQGLHLQMSAVTAGSVKQHSSRRSSSSCSSRRARRRRRNSSFRSQEGHGLWAPVQLGQGRAAHTLRPAACQKKETQWQGVMGTQLLLGPWEGSIQSRLSSFKVTIHSSSSRMHHQRGSSTVMVWLGSGMGRSSSSSYSSCAPPFHPSSTAT